LRQKKAQKSTALEPSLFCSILQVTRIWLLSKTSLVYFTKCIVIIAKYTKLRCCCVLEKSEKSLWKRKYCLPSDSCWTYSLSHLIFSTLV
jgi:hypothetical protein